MTVDRRKFLQTGAAAAALVAVPRPLLVHLGRRPERVPAITDDRVKALALRAVEAARSAGASYADVRLTHTRSRQVQRQGPYDELEELGVGVRALVNGYWGFAASPLWAPDEAARLGREAVAQARTNALGKARVVELGVIPAVHDGHWTTPVEEDAFTVPLAEMMDFLGGWATYADATKPPDVGPGSPRCQFWRQAKAFASTEGTYLTQTLHRTGGGFGASVKPDDDRPRGLTFPLELVARGWEHVRTVPYREVTARLYAELEELRTLPFKPVEVGRYDVVFDTHSIAALLDQTLGAATELDRAVGYEANAGGTSYLNDPLGMLGSYAAGAPLLTVTGTRALPGGLATAAWDDEGVVPEAFPIVKDGVLADFQTTRESATWLTDYYVRQGRPVRSHGCANAATALEPTLQHPPNLVLAPGPEDHTFDDLVAGLENGFAMTHAGVDMDFQHLNGLGVLLPPVGGLCYEIKKGKKTALIEGAGFLFRAPELWKGLVALGGPSSVRSIAVSRVKGEPAQRMFATVRAVPAVVKQVTVIDPRRKA